MRPQPIIIKPAANDELSPETEGVLRKSKHNLGLTFPVKIMFVDNKQEYCKKVWYSIGIGLSQVMIGATNIIALLYTLNSGDVHVILCTVAYHFFSAQAILCLNYRNGWSALIRQRHRRVIHMIMQMCALILVLVGTVIVITDKGVSMSAHGITGITAVVLAGLCLISGPLATLFNNKRYLVVTHMSFGSPTFLMSSISLILGLYTQPFKQWSDPSLRFILLGFISFYTVIIIVTVFIKCMSKYV